MLQARVCGVVRGAWWVVPSPAPCCPPGPAGDGEGLCVASSAAHSTTGDIWRYPSACSAAGFVFSSPFSMLVMKIWGRVIYCIPHLCA